MKKENYSYNSVFNYLKSGLVGIDHEDVSLLENYVIASLYNSVIKKQATENNKNSTLGKFNWYEN